MKFIVEASNLWEEIAAVKSATFSKLVSQGLLITATDTIKVASNGRDTYAEANVNGEVIEQGHVVMNFNALDLLQFVEGTLIIELKDKHLYLSGSAEAKLNIMDTDPEFYKPPTYCVDWTKIDADFFRILYATGNIEPKIHVQGNMFACGNGKAFAGFRNSEPVTHELIALSTDLPISRGKPFYMGVVSNKVWYRSENMIAAMPLVTGPNHIYIDFGYYENLTDIGFTADTDALLKAANYVHQLSKSAKNENNDGRCSLQLAHNSLLLVAGGNEVGAGNYSLEVRGDGSLTFGLSTTMLKNAIANVSEPETTIRLAHISGNQVLIVIGETTRHFIAEDPSARDV